MSRIPPGLARRLDRLARRAHAFHRWAHHPLCSGYAAEVIRIGRRGRVCLGCALTAAGAVAGVALGLICPAGPPPALVAGGLVLLAAVPIVVRNPARTAKWKVEGPDPLTRARKLFTRFLPAAAAAFLVAQAAGAPSAPRIVAAALAGAAVGWGALRYRRRGPDRSACPACPQGPAGARCPGLSPIVRRERALSRLASRWIAASPESGDGAAHCSGAPWGPALPVPAPLAGEATAAAPPRPSPAGPPAGPPTPPRPSSGS